MTDTYNVGAMLKQQAAEQPDTTALVFPGRGRGWASWTFAQLDRRSDRYAAGLAAKGLRRGDRTLFLMRPSLEFYAVMFGAMKLGAVPVLIDPGMGLRNVLACVEEIAPRAVIALPLVHAVRTFVRRPFASADILVTAGSRWFWGGLTLDACLGPDAPYEMAPFAASDEVGIVFTSGSTGTPKGVTYTHGIFHAVASVAGEQLGRGPGKVNLETFAAYVLFDVAQGMTAVVPDMDLSKPAKVDPTKLVEAIEAWNPQTAFASPVVLRRLFRHCEATGASLPFRDVLTGVAPIPGELHRQLRALAPEATLHVNYGATEGMTAAHITTDEVLGETWALTGKGHGNCVGRPFPGMTVRIMKITSEPVPEWSDAWLVPDGEIGEIVLQGPVVSPEYKDRPEANAAAKVRLGDEILHRMGDLAYRDADGRLWFCGRKKHRLQTAGGMVPAVPPEGVFNEHPEVLRTALVGVGEPGEEVPVLCVELEAGASWSERLERELLALADGTRWEGVVQRVLRHDGFPVDARHNSKIRREDLKVWATHRLGPMVATETA